MQGQARLNAAVGTLASVGAPVGSALPAVRMSDGLDTNAIRQGLGIEQARFPGARIPTGSKIRGMPGSSIASDALNVIGSISSIASFLQGIGNNAPQESIDRGNREQQHHEAEVTNSKQCASAALEVIDKAHEQCAGAAESVVDKVLKFLKISLVAGDHPALAAAVETVMGAAAKFIETLVMGRNMTVTGCLQNLCHDMEKPATSENSGKAICQAEQAPAEKNSVSASEAPPEQPPTAGNNCDASANGPKNKPPLAQSQPEGACETPQKPVMDSPCDQSAGKPSSEPDTVQPVGTPSPVDTPPPAPVGEHSPVGSLEGVTQASDDCATKASSVEAKATLEAAAYGNVKTQPPAIPPSQVPGIVCNHMGLGSTQWHGFLSVVTDLLCPSGDSGGHVPSAHAEPPSSEPPKHVAPVQPPCEEVHSKDIPGPLDDRSSETVGPGVKDKCEQSKPEPSSPCVTSKSELPEPAEPVKTDSPEQTSSAKLDSQKPCEPEPPECHEHQNEKQEDCSNSNAVKDGSKTDKPVSPPVNDKAPADGYHGFDKTKHPSFPGNTPGPDPAPHLSGGTVGDTLAAPPEPNPEAPAQPEPPMTTKLPADTPQAPPANAPADPSPEQQAPEPPIEKPVVPPAVPHDPGADSPEGSWSPDIWVGAGISAEVHTAGNDVALELAGAAAFGVEVERSGAW